MEERKIKPLSVEWFTTHNFLPYVFTGILAIIGIITYFSTIITKEEVINAQMSDLQINYDRTVNLLRDQIGQQGKELDAVQKCTNVLGASISAATKPVGRN